MSVCLLQIYFDVATEVRVDLRRLANAYYLETLIQEPWVSVLRPLVARNDEGSLLARVSRNFQQSSVLRDARLEMHDRFFDHRADCLGSNAHTTVMMWPFNVTGQDWIEGATEINLMAGRCPQGLPDCEAFNTRMTAVYVELVGPADAQWGGERVYTEVTHHGTSAFRTASGIKRDRSVRRPPHLPNVVCTASAGSRSNRGPPLG